MDTAKLVRKNELEGELGKMGLSLRMDSKLCYCYVNGQTGPEWDVHRVVHECCVMHWLYNFTNYERMCEFAAFNESRRNYFHTQRDLMSYMRRYVHPVVKEAVIRDNGGLPEAWPWLTIDPGDPGEPGDPGDPGDPVLH
jgi:hypothetical protein